MIVYRYKDRPGEMGGTSVSTVEPKYLAREKYTAYRITAKDVLAHYAQEDSPLASKAFGHEKEIILHRDAKPERIEP